MHKIITTLILAFLLACTTSSDPMDVADASPVDAYLPDAGAPIYCDSSSSAVRCPLGQCCHYLRNECVAGIYVGDDPSSVCMADPDVYQCPEPEQVTQVSTHADAPLQACDPDGPQNACSEYFGFPSAVGACCHPDGYCVRGTTRDGMCRVDTRFGHEEVCKDDSERFFKISVPITYSGKITAVGIRAQIYTNSQDVIVRVAEVVPGTTTGPIVRGDVITFTMNPDEDTYSVQNTIDGDGPLVIEVFKDTWPLIDVLAVTFTDDEGDHVVPAALAIKTWLPITSSYAVRL